MRVRRRLRTPAVALAFALAAGLALACDGAASRVLGLLGVAHVSSLGPEEARGRLADGARLVQVRDEGAALPALAGALHLPPEGAIPDELRAPGADVIVVAAESGDALALAARLVRAGVSHVAVVEGELPVLAALVDPPPANE